MQSVLSVMGGHAYSMALIVKIDLDWPEPILYIFQTLLFDPFGAHLRPECALDLTSDEQSTFWALSYVPGAILVLIPIVLTLAKVYTNLSRNLNLVQRKARMSQLESALASSMTWFFVPTLNAMFNLIVMGLAMFRI